MISPPPLPLSTSDKSAAQDENSLPLSTPPLNSPSQLPISPSVPVKRVQRRTKTPYLSHPLSTPPLPLSTSDKSAAQDEDHEMARSRHPLMFDYHDDALSEELSVRMGKEYRPTGNLQLGEGVHVQNV